MRDRKLTHEQILAGVAREDYVQNTENERDYQKLRAALVEKYGEDGVQKVEARELAAAEKAHSEGRFVSNTALTAWESK